MIRFGLASASMSLLAFYVVSNMDVLPVFRTVVMPIADGTPVPVLTGLNVPNFIMISIIGVAMGVVISTAGYWVGKQLSAYLPTGSPSKSLAN